MPILDRSTLAAQDLVDAYEPGRSAVFATPLHTILAVGNQLGDPATAQDELVERAATVLALGDVDLILAAIPFDSARPAALVLPHRIQVSTATDTDEPPLVRAPVPVSRDALDSEMAAAVNGHAHREPVQPVSANGQNGHRWRIDAQPTRSVYEASVRDALGRISSGVLGKIVLARSLDLTGGGRTDAAAMLRRLAARDPQTSTYAIGLPSIDGRARELVGASPELLVSRTGRRVVARPVAGSAERSADPVEDRLRGEALMRSAKDLAEHAFVVEAVQDSLAPYCRDVIADPPSLTSTATMWHLQTEVVGELLDPTVSSLALALALHPTPAVCGTPTAVARAAIDELEGFDRDYYAGVVGWCDRSGDGEWVVAIRCAEVRADSLRLYAGAGIVAASEPEAEVRETSAKFRTMLQALGLDDIA